MATRCGRKWRTAEQWGAYDVPYLSILVNNIELSGRAVETIDPFFPVYIMAVTGGAAYVPETNTWAEFTPFGRLLRTGMPRFVRLRGDLTWSEPIEVGDTVHIYPANPEFMPPVFAINARTDMLAAADASIRQNLDSLREMGVAVTDDSRATTQIQQLNNIRRAGGAFGIFQTDKTSDMLKESPFQVIRFGVEGVQNNIESYLKLREAYRQELSEIVGIAQLGEKPERRVNGEIDLAIDNSGAIIDLIIASINRYAKYYGDDVHAERRKTAVPPQEEIREEEDNGDDQSGM